MTRISMPRSSVLLSVTTLVSMSVGSAGCTARPPADSGDPAGPVTVTAAPVTSTDVSTPIDAGGVVQARVTATIGARILAPVRALRVAPGDRVRAGQTLVVLDGEDLAATARAARAAAAAAEHEATAAAAELQAAQASLILARASYDRVAALQARRSATAQELDEVTAALRSAEARVAGVSARGLQAASVLQGARASSDRASVTSSYTVVTAPFDGVITRTLVEAGNMVTPGMPLVRLEDTSGFRLEVRVDESRLSGLRNGQRVPVLLGTENTPIPGTVVEVSPAIDADARSYLVKIALPESEGLRSGVFGRATFAGPPRRGVIVPASSVVRHGQVTSVFVIEGGRARLRLVNVHGSEVLAGLTASEVVVLSPPAGLTDGRRVSVGRE